MAMELDDTFDQALDRYVSGEMSPHEREAFQSSLAKDPRRQKLLEAEQLVRQVAATEFQQSTIEPSPSPALLEYLRTTPAKRTWSPGMLVTVVGLVAFLAILSYFIFQSQRTVIRESQPTPAAVPSQQIDTPTAPVRPLALPAGDSQPIPKVMTNPSTSPKAAEQESDLDAHLNKPRVIRNDSMRIH